MASINWYLNKMQKDKPKILLEAVAGLSKASSLHEGRDQRDLAVNSNSNQKTRRRSVLVDESQSQDKESPVFGYEQRRQRLQYKGESEDCFNGQAAKEEFNTLFAKGVYLLSMREHSVQEMQDKLNARSDNVTIVLAVVDELVVHRYLSDERFAETYVRSRQNRGFGPIKIRSELSSKGIANRLIEEFLDIASVHWIDIARQEYKKKYKASDLESYKEWAKRARFMQSRGFTMEHIQVVIPRDEYS